MFTSDGYVPAASFYNFPFYGALSLAYMLFGLLWLITCSLHSEELIQLQFFITGGIALGMIETVLLYSHFYSWNETGTVSGSLFGVGVDMKRVLYLGAGYVVLSSVYTLGASIPSGGRYVGDPTYENLYSLVVMLLATVDTCFYMWIFSSLSNII
ncbi:TMEM87B, partial [Symbiodinium microadriaticum]